MSSLAWANTNCKESDGIIKGFTLLVDKTLMYSYIALTFSCKLITPRDSCTRVILMSVSMATVYFINFVSLITIIKVLFKVATFMFNSLITSLLV